MHHQAARKEASYKANEKRKQNTDGGEKKGPKTCYKDRKRDV